MEKKPLISIIIAIYKSEKFIHKCIDSVLNQTYSNLEIVLVDDGSPDNCPKICDDYKEKDERIVVIHKENGGTCEARNSGLQRITGEYVSIIDGDDWLEPDYVEYLYELVRQTNSDMSMTDNIFTTRDREQILNDAIETWTNEEAATAIVYPVIAIGPWNKLYKVSMLKQNNIDFSVPWSGEGLYFSCMAAQYSNHVGVGHRKIYNYRLNNTGSGLTNYRVVMGTNALDNIKNIEKISIVRTTRFMNAVKWHMLKNYHFIVFLIIATDSREENAALFNECMQNIRKRTLDVALHSELDMKQKIKLVLKGINPVFFAKKELLEARKGLENDHME
jgi:glycosyltransferase involved in cell wall biosynthesis